MSVTHHPQTGTSMQVFLSWSGPRSKLVATALNEYLPLMLHPISCWISEADLPKGKPWFDELTKALNSIIFALICVTPENESAPWLLWESGFLSSASALGDRRIVPLAVGRPKNSLSGPLSIYQATDTSREDIQRLILQINAALPEDRQVVADKVQRTFNHIWPELERKLIAALAIPIDAKKPPQPEPREQQSEVLALLRQQQRAGAELKSMIGNLESRFSQNPTLGLATVGPYSSSTYQPALDLQLSGLNSVTPLALKDEHLFTIRDGSLVIPIKSLPKGTTLNQISKSLIDARDAPTTKPDGKDK
jgi:hypothetical protein